MKKIKLFIYTITVILAGWSVYSYNQMQGLNIYKLSIEMGNFIVYTYKYFYIACLVFIIISLKFLVVDIKELKAKLAKKSENVKAKFNAGKENKKAVISKDIDESEITCVKCGYSNKATNKFCQKCGEKIETVLGEVE